MGAGRYWDGLSQYYEGARDEGDNWSSERQLPSAPYVAGHLRPGQRTAGVLSVRGILVSVRSE